MFKLSISNIAWLAEADEYMYSLIKRMGFSGLEIAPTRIITESPYDRLDIASSWENMISDTYGIHVSSMQSIWYGRTEKMFRSEEERNVLQDYTFKAIDFAKAIGCGNLVFGCPSNRVVYSKEDKELAIAFFREIGEYAFEHGTAIGIEANPTIYNTNFINTTQEAISLIKCIDSEGIKLNLDIGTMIFNNEKVEILKENIHLINHIHISEPFLKVIQERPIHKELKKIIKDKYDKYVSIEMGNGCSIDTIEKVMAYVKGVFE